MFENATQIWKLYAGVLSYIGFRCVDMVELGICILV
nr:MAG TPA: hypothetical protein [Caudoviricetes sp.]